MKNFSLLILLTLFFSCTKNKEPIVSPTPNAELIDSAYVASKTRYFTIENGNIRGDGQAAINQMIESSQFIVLGESHGSSETSKLTAALMPALSKSGFRHFAVEVGPYSANKLMELSQPATNTIQNLHDFNSQYYYEAIDDVSIPFFHGVEDAEFLQAASENNIGLWGLDQEYFSSIIYQTDELLDLVKDKSDFEAIQQMKTEADKVIREWFVKDEESARGIDLFPAMLKEPSIIAFFGQFNKTDDPVAWQMIEDIKISWDIYSRWRKGSHADRVSYMRNNFLKNYQQYAQSEDLPKVLLKFGRLHAPKIISGGVYDIGHLVNELATKNGTKCSNVSLLNRYHEEDGKVIDNLTESSYIYYQRVKPFMQQGKRDQWAFIDLTAIQQDLAAGSIYLPVDGSFHSLKALIEGFDYQIILPLDKDVTNNYSLE